jgi:tRNA nucleotidyltransferase (CCA-adding enzyme)
MKTYLVGGAVRDKVMGRECADRDWVVVGGTPEEMLAKGFTKVGADFPVFLHPETGEEYALARTERKTGPEHVEFATTYNPSVTLFDDLLRRDLTINAMAMDEAGEITDPFNGQQDIKDGILRMTSSAFSEDALRVLRVARFAARFGFKVHETTLRFMDNMVACGELALLTPERVWKETYRALGEDHPRRFWEVLHSCNALQAVFPEMAGLVGIEQPEHAHGDTDAWVHTLNVLDKVVELGGTLEARWAAMCHDLGKANTPKDVLPKHPGHDKEGAKIAAWLSNRLAVPTKALEHAVLAAENHMKVHQADLMKAKGMVRFLHNIDAFRRPQRLEAVLLVSLADHFAKEGEVPESVEAYDQANLVREALKAALTVDTKAIVAEGYTGATFGDVLRSRRVHAVKHLLKK